MIRHFLDQIYAWRRRREVLMLSVAATQAYEIVPYHTFVAFTAEPAIGLHGVLQRTTPDQLDWSHIVVPPETTHATATIYFPGDAKDPVPRTYAMLGDRKGRYSFCSTRAGEVDMAGLRVDLSDQRMVDMFGSFAHFHEAFDGPAEG